MQVHLILSNISSRRCWLVMAACVISASVCVHGDDKTPPTDSPSKPEVKVSSKLPVILLTGFEPFGAERPPNPSWEGIKTLDGTEWRGHRLVCKQLPVIWGKPLEQIEGWVAELKPVAIFSFGQGGGGAFALESRAANRRGGGADNDGQRPPQPQIVSDGPDELKATIDCQRLKDWLTEKGHSVRISKNAGAYLCEETLYTLEYLKTKNQQPAHVMFCHVPPLDGKKVTPEFVQTFVLDLLSAWGDVYLNEALEPAKPRPASVREDARTADVKQFVERYFKTWSNREMEAYGEGFLAESIVQFIDAKSQVTTQGTVEFLAEQRRFQAQRHLREIPLTIEIRFEGRLARAVVYWRLDDGSLTSRYGYDHFTLVERDGKWRILNLAFYSAPGPEKSK